MDCNPQFKQEGVRICYESQLVNGGGLEPQLWASSPLPSLYPLPPPHPSSHGPLSLQKQRLRSLVWQPLCSLARALAGPQNLIKKRLDKLLDFDRVEEKLLDVGSVTWEEEAARHEYQALNSLLVAELPQFNQLVMQWLGQILCTFVVLQRDLADQVLRRAESTMALVRLWGLRLLWSIARQDPKCCQGRNGDIVD
jgi:hypothetical protein